LADGGFVGDGDGDGDVDGDGVADVAGRAGLVFLVEVLAAARVPGSFVRSCRRQGSVAGCSPVAWRLVMPVPVALAVPVPVLLVVLARRV
jgi:hypothetical protein